MTPGVESVLLIARTSGDISGPLHYVFAWKGRAGKSESPASMQRPWQLGSVLIGDEGSGNIAQDEIRVRIHGEVCWLVSTYPVRSGR